MVRNIIKKVTCLTLILIVSLLSSISCKKQKYGEEIPVYTSEKEFYFGTWVEIRDTYVETDPITGEKVTKYFTDEEFDYQYQLLKEAGFNHTMATNYERALPVAEKYGINMYLSWSPINALLMDDVRDEEAVLADLRALNDRFSQYKSFAGVNIADEPSFDQIKNYSGAKERFDKVFKDKVFYINLFPAIAGPDRVSDKYENYIKEFVDKIGTDYVSYDHYPLKVNPKNENYIVPTFLYNMELLKFAAPGKQHWTFLQSIQYTPNNRTLTSVADAGFQAYSYLAFGGHGIQWFCYNTPSGPNGAEQFGEACIGLDGKTTDIYHYVKTINNEIHSFEHIYFSFDWQGVMTTIGSENDNGGENDSFSYLEKSLIQSHDRIKSIKTQQDTLTGVFKDADGRDGFMVVNYTEPSKQLKNKVEIEFKNSTRAIVVKKGVQSVVDTVNGKLSFTMDAGEGYFVIPLK